ncbi:MAG: BamA/TamA family outer membrane protein [Prevotellaceae bacterium]|jgi:outer membrane protein assembly factor BamA|nr:BamA/TamA family outer membrane protein [Prevotellaceae bacterium]
MICPLRTGALLALLTATTATATATTVANAPPADSSAAPAYAFATVKRIDATDEQQEWLRKAGIDLKKFEGKPADKSLMTGVLQKFIRHCENNGYPFARAQLGNVRIDSGYFYATLTLSRGNLITIDSLIVKGAARVRPSFLQKHLGLRKPRLYSETFVNDVDRRINELAFVSTAQPSAVEFRQRSSTLYTYLMAGKANRASGMAAFSTDENGKLQLNGEASLFAANLFKGGEELGLDWSSPDKKTQLLRVAAGIPYLILGTIGAHAQLDMERRDTLYMRVNGRLGLSAQVSRHAKASLFAELQQHSNTANTLQPVAVNLTLYGADLTIRSASHPQFPRSGYAAYLALAAGKRSVTTSANSATGVSVEGTVDASRHFLSSRRTSILARVQGKAKAAFSGAAGESLLQSELHSIGGAATLRGFNERSILTEAYAIATLEPRLFYAPQGYLHTFYDFAVASNPEASRTDKRSMLHSFGAGTQLATTAGIFAITYALGCKIGEKPLLKNAKVHVAYTTVF